MFYSANAALRRLPVSFRKSTLCFVMVLSCCFSVFGQFKTELVNDEGAMAPCIGIGPIGGPAATKCVELFQNAGFVKADEVGITGMVIGTSEKDDGIITGVVPRSPAAQAGVAVGDVLLTINGTPVKPAPGEVAIRLLFGKKNEEVTLTVERGETTKTYQVNRRAESPPPDTPKSTNFFMSVKPLINWRGEFVPCLGVGPAGAAAIAYCDSHFKPYGYIKVGERGSSGLKVNVQDASILSVDRDSPGASAGIQAGDRLVAVDGKPLTGGSGESANQRLFGKVGEHFKITIQRLGSDMPILLTLAEKPKS
jgi:membrane-associated protease RseP (regulator of RpoE activity)